MSTENTTRWTVTASKQTDAAVRSLLAQRGLKKGGLSHFIEEAVKWRVFEKTLAETREAFADLTPDELQELLNEAGEAVHAEMRPNLPDAFRQAS